MKTAAQPKFTVRIALVRPFVWMSLGCLGITGALLSFAFQPAIAQTANSSDALQGGLGSSDRASDPFSSNSDQLGGLFNLMHKFQQGSIRSGSEFSQDQQSSIGSAASDFRTRQLQLLHQQGQGTTDSAVPQTSQPVQPAN